MPSLQNPPPSPFCTEGGHARWLAAQDGLKHAAFEGVRESIEALGTSDWPSLTSLNRHAVLQRITNAGGLAIQFVAPTEAGASAMQYETSIATTGDVPTRENWHDLFNAFAWLNFPKIKAATNAMHVKLLHAHGHAEARARSVPRDVLTMFDESGIIVASRDATLLQLIRDFQWKTLFVTRREDVLRDMRFSLCGHGLLEKSLAPFIGITAKAMLLEVDEATLDDHAEIDRQAANWLSREENLAEARNLSPLPLLGIPGWDARNLDKAFYDNAQYFRPGYLQPARNKLPSNPAS